MVARTAMSDSRELTLERVRRAVSVAPTPEPPAAWAYRRAGQLDSTSRVELFGERVREYSAEAHIVNARQLRDAVADAFARHGAAAIAVPPGVPAAWRPAGIDIVEDAGQSPSELDRLDGVLTGCALAIAETGTVVLAGGPTEGRRALSLMPDVHVCVVEGAQIVELVPEAMTRLGDLVRTQRSPITFISGPSATSDIELSRVEGVHGPRKLIVLVKADIR
jgi:L-lactate dehydrogenase complex protein LldG